MTSLSRSCATSRLEPWTDTHTHRTTTVTLAAHARRGLITDAACRIGILSCGTLDFRYIRNKANSASFMAKAMPPLPEELFICFINLDLNAADSMKKHRLGGRKVTFNNSMQESMHSE